MLAQPAIYAGLGLLCGAAVVVTRNVLQKRRQNRRRQRREHLRSLGRRNGLELQGRHLPEEIVERAARFRGRVHRVVVDEVLSGLDEGGRYRLGRRTLDGEEHHFLECEIRFDGGLAGLHVEPTVRTRGSRAWWRRRREARSDDPGASRVRLLWDTRPDMLREVDAMAALQRLADAVAKGCVGSDALPMGLEIADGSLLIHSTRPLEGPALAEFLRRGLLLRATAMGEIMRRHARRVATTTSTVLERAEARRAQDDTRPLFEVPEREGAQDDGAATVTLSAAELLRELPDPRQSARRSTRSGGHKRGFEIPEPEEEVVLLRAW